MTHGTKRENKKDSMKHKMKPESITLEKPKKELIVSLIASLLFLSAGIFILGYYYYQNLFPFSKIDIKQVNENQAAVYIASRIPLKTSVQYGTSDYYFNETPLTSNFTKTKVETLEGLLPSRSHYFRILAWDENGKQYYSKFYIL